MDTKEVKEGKKQYLDLLLLADEQENMIDQYLTNEEVVIFKKHLKLYNKALCLKGSHSVE